MLGKIENKFHITKRFILLVNLRTFHFDMSGGVEPVLFVAMTFSGSIILDVAAELCTNVIFFYVNIRGPLAWAYLLNCSQKNTETKLEQWERSLTLLPLILYYYSFAAVWT